MGPQGPIKYYLVLYVYTCAAVCAEAKEQPQASFLKCHPPCLAGAWSLPISLGCPASKPQGAACLYLPPQRWGVFTSKLAGFTWSNLGPHACTVRTLPAEPSSRFSWWLLPRLERPLSFLLSFFFFSTSFLMDSFTGKPGSSEMPTCCWRFLLLCLFCTAHILPLPIHFMFYHRHWNVSLKILWEHL